MSVPTSPDGPPANEAQVLLFDESSSLEPAVIDALRVPGLTPRLADDLEEARTLFETGDPAVYVIGIESPTGPGVEFLHRVRAEDPHMPVVLLTERERVQVIAHVAGQASTSCLARPFDPVELVLLVRRALGRSQDRRELQLHRRRTVDARYEEMVGASAPMQDLFDLLGRLEDSNLSTVLIQGESGTGKELVARAIYHRSRRRTLPFLEIDCTGLNDELVQSELFGHERGAFTDAKERKTGLFEAAGEGTVFLDEIGELGLQTQSKLLRALESRTFRPVGGTSEIRFRGRVLAATNRDLAEEAARGRFREDLYYRLAVIPVVVPPLRERHGDVPLLANHLAALLSRQLGRKVPRITPRTLKLLEAYPWPGNVRELRNVLERAIILHNHEITPADLPREVLQPHAPDGSEGRDGGVVLPWEGLDLADVERSLIRQALNRCEGNRTQAGKLLGLSRFSLRYRAKKLGLLE